MDNKQNDSFFYQRQLYIITAKTNMHVGSGEETYGLIDNRVQRDVLSNLPNINASGLKGALREYFSQKFGERSQAVIEIFGSDSSAESKKPEPQHKAGKFRFFNGNLLSIPVRSNVRTFFRATSTEVLQDLTDNLDTFAYEDTYGIRESLEHIKDLAGQGKTAVFFDGEYDKEVVLEDYRVKAVKLEADKYDKRHIENLERITGGPLVLITDMEFKDICSDYNLPLIARNNLENGRSQNLWHEQVIPRETKFYFFVLKPVDCNQDIIFSPGEPVQIGANASIGYGFCRIEEAEQLLKGSGKQEIRS